MFGKPSKTEKRAQGDLAEDAAVTHLKQHKATILARNVNCRLGEIDIVARHKSHLLFVEVRFRKNNLYGSPAETVTQQKQQKIIRASQWFLQQNPKLQQLPCRFDVISMQPGPQALHCEWICDAFTL